MPTDSTQSSQDLYEADFAAWAFKTATLLRSGRTDEIYLEHVAEEIESLGRHEKRLLKRRFIALMVQLLKWQHQPVRRSRGWVYRITTQRERVTDLLADSPSLQPAMQANLAEDWSSARMGASRLTGFGLDFFPVHCPWSLEQILTQDFVPGQIEL